MIHVFYHAGCRDGFCSAWLAWKYFTSQGIDDVEYTPVQYGDEPPLVKIGSRVFILDFSFGPEILIQWSNICKTVVLIDHHKSAAENLATFPKWSDERPNLHVIFDMNKSGAMLTLEHFFKNGPPISQYAQDIVVYVQDRDIWEWKLPNSREVSAALSVVPFDFKAWDEIVIDSHFIERGDAILAAQNQIVQSLCDKAFLADHWGDFRNIPCLNTSVYQSEIGNELCNRFPDAPFSATWFTLPPDDEGRFADVWSLRSIDRIDVSQVAKGYGGGGHPNAAGFTTIRQLQWFSPPNF